ncbi:hypothetical protein M426DRAFT_44573, partial [Hypoxylon sp. CI-4A]
AGAYMKAKDLPMIEFLDHYEKSAREVLDSVPTLWEYNESVPSDQGPEARAVAKTVFTTWNLSFALLE